LSGKGDDYVGVVMETEHQPAALVVPTSSASADGVRNATSTSGMYTHFVGAALAEPEAIEQLRKTAASLPGIRVAVGMPDLHPGKGFPIGAVFGCQGYVHPFLIGGDIGCGMSLLALPLEEFKATSKRVDKWVR
jgi:RNA-splicing ligase RtcB